MPPTTNEQLAQLAQRLFTLRTAAGLTGDQLAEALSWPRSKISKIENVRQTPSDDDITAWAGACSQLEQAPVLLELLDEARTVHRQWRAELRRGGHAGVQIDLDQRMRAASRIRNAETGIVPGLLQTSAYALALSTEIAGVYGISPDGVGPSVAARMRRQEILYDQGKRFEFVITEAALRIVPCPVEVMAGQLDRLLSLGLPNVTLGVIPFGVPLSMTPVHGFLIVDDVTIVETYSSESELAGPDSESYDRIFGRLMDEAVTGGEARRLISAAAKSLRPENWSE